MVIIALYAVYNNFTTLDENPKERLTYSQLLNQIESKKIKQATIVDDHIRVMRTDNAEFITMIPTNDTTLLNILRQNNIEINLEAPPKPSWINKNLTSMTPMIILLGIWYLLTRQSYNGSGKAFSFGKNPAKKNAIGKIRVTFDDVAGVEESKQELEEIVDFLKMPKKFSDVGAKIPKGILLYGPPGTGKTLLARAVAGEAKVPFFSISGSNFVEMFVGVGASRVRDLFEEAKKEAPCIVFIDEIDAVGRQRGAGLGGGHDEREQTLNQLLVEMDGFGINEGVIIIAATNRPDILDAALLRPGRFDRQIAVDKPDSKGRLAILRVHAKNKPLAKTVNLDIIAKRTTGFTGAELGNIVNEAAILSARQNKKTITMSELEESVERVMTGVACKNKIVSESEKKLTAYHEAGHAIIGLMLNKRSTVHKVSIIPRGRAGGYTLILPREDQNYTTRTDIVEQITMLLGGRASEAIVLKDVSTGAQNDLERATLLARSMVTEYGMSEKIGILSLGKRQDQIFLGKNINQDRQCSEEFAAIIDKEVQNILNKAYESTEQILRNNIQHLKVVAEHLLEYETLTGEEIQTLIDYGNLRHNSENNQDRLEEDAIKDKKTNVPKITY